jgi:hypothetical protein
MKKTLLLFITLLTITITNAQTVGDNFTEGDYSYEVTVVGTPNEVKVVGYTVTDLVIPTNVSNAGNDFDVTLLPSAVFKDDATITSVTSSAPVAIALQSFQGCSGLLTVSLPNAISIGNSAFLNCSSLTTVDISSVLGTLGNNTFKGCPVLATIDASSADTIGNNAFQNSGPLTTADFSSITSLGSQSFRNTTAVSLSFPSLTHLGGAADPTVGLSFWQAAKLKSINIPVVQVINTGAFNSCAALESITFPSTLTALTEHNYNMFKGCTSLTDVIVEYTTFIPLVSNPDGTSANTSIFADIFGATLTIPATVNAADYSGGDIWQNFSKTVLSVNSLEKTSFNVYPNPTTDYLNFSSKEVHSVDIYNILGAKVSSQKVLNNVDMTQLNKGIYFLKAKNIEGLEFKTVKVIKK